MELIYQKRTGLLYPATRIAHPVIEDVRMTIPAREALEAAGHKVKSVDGAYVVELRGKAMPDLVAKVRYEPYEGGTMGQLVLRLPIEPPWPRERDEFSWRCVEWMACPKCHAPIVWYEAGFVPGYRICTGRAHHHLLLSR